VVIAEFFTAISGLGGVIINASSNFETARMFVPIVILMLLALVVNRLVTIVAEIVAPWQKELASKQDD
jgi:NitT/TauT family transport system permease protein